MKKIILCFGLCIGAIAAMLAANLPQTSAAEEEPTENINENEAGEYDFEAPVIYGVSEYTISNKSKLSISALKAALTVVDNVDENLEPLLFEDSYSSNWEKPGTYYITFKAKDSAGNYGSFIVTVNVVDTSGPIFSTEDGLPIVSYTVHKSPSAIFLLSEVMENITVTDDIDGIISEVTTVQDTYSGNGDKTGNYKIVVAATDKAGNKSNFTINIEVTSNIPDKTIVIDRKLIIVENTVKLTNEDFSNILKVCGYYNTNTTTYIDIDATSYQVLSENVGDYLIEYELTTTAGTTKTGSFQVRVTEARDSENTIVSESDGFIKKIIKFILNLLKAIADFFANLFNGNSK